MVWVSAFQAQSDISPTIHPTDPAIASMGPPARGGFGEGFGFGGGIGGRNVGRGGNRIGRVCTPA